MYTWCGGVCVCTCGVVCVHVVVWCCGVVLLCGVVVWCCFVWCGVVRLAMRKTPPCVDSKRIRVCVQDASVCTGKTRVRLLCLCCSLSSFCLSFCLSLSLSLPLLFSLSLFPLFSLVFPLSNDDNDHSSSRLSLFTHGSDLCQSACTLAYSLFGEHVRIIQETTVLVLLCKPRATWNEVGLYLRWKWVMCLVVFGCVSMC